MRPYDIIKAKRDGLDISYEEMKFMVMGFVEDRIPSYQFSAFLMAGFLRGFSENETLYLTKIMTESGKVMDLSGVEGPKIDKHSTGGIGDKVSIILAPLVASAGVKVPMISGRGLGHTGGTLDKLESIPNFDVNLSQERFLNCLKKVGVVMAGQTESLAPADRKIYALRDVTATVDSIPLIISSIMSKKLAEGIDGLVLDVKTGSGAFMKDLKSARILAQGMVGVGRGMGKKVSAFITDMNQPLGEMAGNSLEIIESIETLKGGGPADLREVTLTLSARMLMLGGIVSTMQEGMEVLNRKIQDGSALEKFREMVEAQKGDPRVVDDYSLLPGGREKLEFVAERTGYIYSMDTEKIGIAILLTGAGRERVEDKIDYGAGMRFFKKLGDKVERGEPLCLIQHNGKGRIDESLAILKSAYTIEEEPPPPTKIIYEEI